LDTSFIVVLATPKDCHHARAVELSQGLSTNPGSIVTSRAVLIEIGNAWSETRHRDASVNILSNLHADPRIGIVELDREQYERAIELYSNRRDKELGLTDCASFLIMRERGISQALNSDDHFVQAGFQALPL